MWLQPDTNDVNGAVLAPIERDPHFPAVSEVLLGITYGYLLEYTGTYPGGGSIIPASVMAYDLRDGLNARIVISNSPYPTAVNAVYAATFLQSGLQQLGPQEWVLIGTVTGDGEFLAPLTPGHEYQFKVETTYLGHRGTYVGNTVWITYAVNRRRILIRDRTAKAALRVARRFGRTVWWQNPGRPHVRVWAVCEGGFESLGLLGGETSATRFTLWIPRQTEFPPLPAPPGSFMTGAAVWVDGIPYAARVTYDAESPEFAPVFRVDCERYDITVELDGKTTPPGI